MANDLVYLMSKLECFTRYYGMSTRAKLANTALSQTLRRGLLLQQWLDLLYTVMLLTLIDTDQEELLLYYLPDLNYLLLNKRRHLLTPVNLCFRLSGALASTMFHLDDLVWLRQANKIYGQRVSDALKESLEKVSRRCELFSVLIVINFAISIGVQQILCLFIYTERNAKSYMWHAQIHCTIYAVINSPPNIYAFMKLFFMSRVCSMTFQASNKDFYDAIIDKRNYSTFSKHLNHFSELYIMVRNLLIYLRKAYLCLLLCYMPIFANFYYNAFYTEIGIVFKAVYVNFLLVTCCMLLFYAQTIGNIETQAKSIENPFYRHFVIENTCRWGSRSNFQLLRFFSYMHNSTIGMKILDQPINIITIFLTIMTLVLANIDRVLLRFS